jgi:hypothetical protein
MICGAPRCRAWSSDCKAWPMIVAALDGRADLFERLTRCEIADAGIGLDILAGAGLASAGMAARFAARSNAADLPEC